VAGFLGKGWKYPVEIDRSGGVAFSEEEESVRQSIFIILGTAPGERVMRPTFGCDIHELLYAPSNQTTASLAAHYCMDALLKWEPRIKDVTVDAAPSTDEPTRIDIAIRYRVRETNAMRNLVYPFYLAKADEK
jgi:uncharacterized protein